MLYDSDDDEAMDGEGLIFSADEQWCDYCGSTMLMVEIADFECPTCGNYWLWGGE